MDLSKKDMKASIYRLLLILILTLGIIFQSLTVVRSALWYPFGMGFWGPTGRDLVWHLALVEQLLKNIPPQNPGLSGTMLVNYHYYYDLLVAVTHKLTGISVSSLVFQVSPIILSLLFGLGTIVLTKRLFKDRLVTIVALFMVFFTSSFGWVVEFIRERHFGGESLFWMNQPVSMNLNPPFASSMCIVIGLLLLWDKYFKKPSTLRLLNIGLITFLLFYFKSYAGLIMSFAFLYSCINTLLQKKYKQSWINLWLFVTVLGFLFWLNRQAASSLEWQPMWLVNGAIAFPDRVGWDRLSSAITNYQLSASWIKFLGAELLAILIFVIGNLGLRIIAFSALFANKMRTKVMVQMLLFLSVVSLVPVLLFVQKGTPWNTIQFGYYSLYFMALVSAAMLVWLLKHTPSVFGLLLGVVILFLSAISSYTTFTFGLYPLPPAMLSKSEFEALEFLKNAPEGGVIIYPYNDDFRTKLASNPYPLPVYADTDYVAAFSQKAVYIGDVEQQKILQSNFQDRVDEVNSVFYKDLPPPSEVRYLYIPKIYGYQYVGTYMHKIFDNESVLIYGAGNFNL